MKIHKLVYENHPEMAIEKTACGVELTRTKIPRSIQWKKVTCGKCLKKKRGM